MRILFLIALLITGLTTSGQTKKEPFSYLTKIEVGSKTELMEQSISFDASISKVFNVKRSDLPNNDPFHSGECDGDKIKVISTKINSSSKDYYVFEYNLTCCCSWGYTIYKNEDYSKPVGRISASQLFVPGNGNIYSISHIGTDYLVRKKYRLTGDGIEEVKQPFNYVGIKSKTLKPIKIYSEKEMVNEIASLPENYEVEILISDGIYESEKRYLVKTSFGLVGWTKLEAGQYKSIDVDGLFYWGS